ncbi:MAG: DUF3343 domain-containing protein [Longimicrobiales bacterium]
MTVFLTFDTTHHALWAEQIARERGLAAQLVHAPPDAGAACDLALEALPEELGALDAALRAHGVPFGRYPPVAE